MNKIYWHTLTWNQQAEILKRAKNLGKTWGWFEKRFKQPGWCNYPGALQGEMGCWSLMRMWESELLKKSPDVTKEYCKKCDCYKPESEE